MGVSSVGLALRRILYVQFADPAGYPPLEHSSLLLANRGWGIMFIGVGAAGELPFEFPAHPRVRVKKLRHVEGGWRQKLQYAVFFCLTLYWTWRWKPKWIYASDPLACPVVWWVRRILGVRVAYHEHDSPNVGGAQTWFMRQVIGYRRKLAREAEICVLPQQTRLLQFLQTTGRGRHVYCVWNCPRLEEMANLSSDQEHRQDQQLVIYYHGSITPARLPIQLVIAASRYNGSVRIRVVGYEAPGSAGYIAELTSVAAAFGLPSMVEYLGTLPSRKDLLRSASRAHVGLCLMPNQSKDINMQHMVGASNKVFDYMACGLPLLVTNLPDWVTAFVEPGYALGCDPDSPDSIGAALRWYLEHPSVRGQMGQKCQEKIRKAWNYESMFVNVMDKIENS
jgi:glycosyltransferase involved in cell wall biosynthesis